MEMLKHILRCSSVYYACFRLIKGISEKEKEEREEEKEEEEEREEEEDMMTMTTKQS